MGLTIKSLRVFECQLNFLTNRTFILPFAILYITTRCNSRCLMCDFWKNQGGDELALSEIGDVADSARRLNIKTFVLSGGEPLLHSDFTTIVRILKETQAKLRLVTNGILLEDYVPLVAKFFSRVYISLDGSTPKDYRKLRGIDAFTNVVTGIKRLKKLNPSIVVIGRTVIQKSNYFDLVSIIKTAKDVGMDHISFLGADVKSSAFGRDSELSQERAQHILLDENDLIYFKGIINGLKKTNSHLFSSKFIIDGFQNLLNIYNYYGAMMGKSEFPRVYCNLPWISAVIEADGKVRPCCFHREIGNIRQESFEKIVNSVKMIEFRRNLRKIRHSMCIHCVFSSARVHLKMLYENI